jgi:hypothetical protein
MGINFTFSNDFTKFLMKVLEEAIKKEVMTSIIKNSMKELQKEDKINEIISEMRKDGSFANIFEAEAEDKNQSIFSVDENDNKNICIEENHIDKDTINNQYNTCNINNNIVNNNNHFANKDNIQHRKRNRLDTQCKNTSISNSKNSAKNTINKLKDMKKQREFKTNSACPHVNKKHYAKNMCYNCYHRGGRSKKAWACIHTDRQHYSFGLCHNCYQNIHNEKNKKSDEIGYFENEVMGGMTLMDN